MGKRAAVSALRAHARRTAGGHCHHWHLDRPAVARDKRAMGRRTSCTNNLKQMGLALINYHEEKGVFPPGYFSTQTYVDGATDTSPGWGWARILCPTWSIRACTSRSTWIFPCRRRKTLWRSKP